MKPLKKQAVYANRTALLNPFRNNLEMSEVISIENCVEW